MLKKQYRLRKNIEFVATYAQKKYVSGLYLIMNIGRLKPNEDFIPKAAFVVSKKIDKRAVIRNKIKRRMRAAYMSIVKDDFSCIKWMSMIFSAKSESKDASFADIREDMELLLKKASEKYV